MHIPRGLVGALVVGVLLFAFVGWPEYRSREDASQVCAEIALGERIDIGELALARRARDLKARYPSLYVAGFHPDDAQAPQGDGAVLMVHLGAFPFGRNLCVLRVQNGAVSARQTVFGADDHAWCRGEMRFVTECDQPASD